METCQHSLLVAKVEESLQSLGALACDNPLVLMVSGGSDSVALLLLVHEIYLRAFGNTKRLLVLHVNHQLRGEEAQEDERFVEALCAELAVPCKLICGKVADLAKEQGVGVEQAGRRFRYEQAELARAEFPGYIVTAHTADDRAETLLQRMIVGGGAGSLASIPRRNGNVIRPLLVCTRQELQSWLTKKSLCINGCLWREDASNLDTRYSRAFVRHEVMPLLASRNPRIIEGLNRTADVLLAESLWMDEQAALLLPLRSDSFSAPLPLLRRAIYLACNDAIKDLAPDARITFEHVDFIASEGARDGFACQIPGGIQLRTTKGKLVFTKAKPPKS